mmetsp:Transcript_19622/g.45879  ORF Transcript_19622/g.45879 Transcript_19622/m.45879 type:complete len:304 (-) Transcript_19622:373-1284(-)
MASGGSAFWMWTSPTMPFGSLNFTLPSICEESAFLTPCSLEVEWHGAPSVKGTSCSERVEDICGGRGASGPIDNPPHSPRLTAGVSCPLAPTPLAPTPLTPFAPSEATPLVTPLAAAPVTPAASSGALGFGPSPWGPIAASPPSLTLCTDQVWSTLATFALNPFCKSKRLAPFNSRFSVSCRASFAAAACAFFSSISFCRRSSIVGSMTKQALRSASRCTPSCRRTVSNIFAITIVEGHTSTPDSIAIMKVCATLLGSTPKNTAFAMAVATTYDTIIVRSCGLDSGLYGRHMMIAHSLCSVTR